MMDNLIQEYVSLPGRIQVYFGVACALLSSGLLFILIISISQLYKKVKGVIARRYRSIVLDELGQLMGQSSIEGTQDSVGQHKLKRLRHLMKKSPTVSKIIIDELLVLKKNIVGDGAEFIVQIYLDLGLKQLSVENLSSRHWKVVAQALRELEMMEQRDCHHLFIGFLQHSNGQLRREARKGLVSLGDNPLFFLDKMKDELTAWEEVFIFKKLKLRDRKYIPDFSRWYNHPNKSVVSFSVKMTAQFGQFHNVDKMKLLLRERDEDLSVLVIESLRKSEAFSALDDVISVLSEARSVTLICVGLDFIGYLGDPGSIGEVRKFTSHPAETVRFAAVRALNSLDPALVLDSEEGKSMLEHTRTALLV